MRYGWMLGCLLSVAAITAVGCGDDDTDSQGETKEGCFFASDNTCSEGVGIGAICDVLKGQKQTCSQENVEGSCVSVEDGDSTTTYYYKNADGSAWSDEFDDAKGNCEFNDGTYTAK